MMTTAYSPPDTPARDLPDDLALPLGTGAPWWYWLGGLPCIDLVNTLRERWRRRVETLCAADDLTAWLRACGLMDADAAPAGDGHLARARALREAVDACLSAAVTAATAPAEAVAVIDAEMAAAPPARLAVDAAGVPVLHEGPSTVDGALGAIARDAARLLGTTERDRIRICASPTCSARFVDRSPGGRRRWCSMGGCGNRAKVRRHRAAHPPTPREPT